MNIKKIEYNNYFKVYLTIDLCGMSIDQCLQKLNKIYEYISNNNIVVIYENYYGDEIIANKIISSRDIYYKKYNIENSPMIYLQGKSCTNDEMSGISVVGIIKKEHTNIKVNRIVENACLIGTIIDDTLSEEIYLISLHGEKKEVYSNFNEEMNDVYKKIFILLKKYGFSVSDIYRTYFYLRNLLVDYNDFNDCRKKFFAENYKEIKIYPASTCIMGHSIYQDRIVSNIFARKTKYDDTFTTINTSKQCEATQYNKLFSRGVQMQVGNVNRAYISGTASIDKDGNTIYKQLPDKQIEQTFKCVDELLKNAGMEMKDIVSAQIYIKKKEFFDIFIKVRDTYGLKNIPGVCVEADVCRDDLLFEMDLIAEKESNNEGR